MNLAQAYLDSNQFEKSLIPLLRAKNDFNEVDEDLYALGYFNYVYGLYFLKQELYNNAELKLQNAIASEMAGEISDVVVTILLRMQKPRVRLPLLVGIFIHIST